MRVSDIIPRKRGTPPSSPPPSLKPRTEEKKSSAPFSKKEPQREKQVVPPEQEPDFFTVAVGETRIDAGTPPVEKEAMPEPTVRRRKGRRRSLRIAAIVFAVLVVAGAGAWFLLPQAAIALTMKKYPAVLSKTVLVAADPASARNASAIVVPAEALTARANLTLPFVAQATETVSARAKGVLMLYNSYSSAPQKLVASTRFESPDKKIFRLEKAVMVPGAKVEGGRVTPSSVEVAVVADEAGEAYNLPASSGWRIPGFRGKPQYEGFYAEAKEGMKEGFIGARAKPSAEELAAARAKLIEGLTGSLESQFLIILSDRFTALPGSRRITLASETVTPDADDPHAFHLFGEAVMEQIVFEEPTLKAMMVAEAGRRLPDGLAVKEFSYSIGTSTPDFAAKTLSFPVEGSGVFTEVFDADAFRASVAGKREDELKTAVFAIPGVEAATVSLWPFFVRSVPEEVSKIEIVVQ